MNFAEGVVLQKVFETCSEALTNLEAYAVAHNTRRSLALGEHNLHYCTDTGLSGWGPTPEKV